MTTDVEQRLREELHRRARAAHTSPSALDEIRARAAVASRPSTSTPWRRPVAALLAAVVLLVVGVWGVVHRRGEPPPPVPPAQPLPDRPPPAVEGTVVGTATGVPCGGHCTYEGPADLDLASPGTPRMLVGLADFGSVPHVLRDGRRVTADRPGSPGSGWSVVGHESGRRIPLGDEHPWSVDVLPDGRAVTFTGPSDDSPPELRIAGPAGATTVALPDDFQPFGVAAGPDGWVALVGQSQDGDQHLLDEAELLLVALRSGRMRRVDIEDAVDEYAFPSATSSLALTWSSRGLIAISASELEPVEERLEHPRGWTVVVDPATGKRVAALPDWHQGLAWAPDGTGLLAARSTDAHTTELRLFWGPGLRHSRDLGTMNLPFVPHWWTSAGQAPLP